MKIRPVIVALSLLAAVAGGFAIKSNFQAHAVPQAVNVSEGGLALGGYDVVAYSTTGAATPGKTIYRVDHDGVVYRFASRKNLLAFETNPQRYLPAYGGYCAYAVSQGYTASIDPDAWAIVDGKLYLNYSKSVQKRWNKDIPGHIKTADNNWPGVLN